MGDIWLGGLPPPKEEAYARFIPTKHNVMQGRPNARSAVSLIYPGSATSKV